MISGSISTKVYAVDKRWAGRSGGAGCAASHPYSDLEEILIDSIVFLC